MQTQRSPFGQFDIRRYVDIFWKRKFFVIVPAVLVIGATVFYVSYRVPPSYRAYALIMFQEKPRFVRSVEGYIVEERDQRRLGAIRTRIYSQEFLDKVITSMGMNNDPEVRSRAERMKKDFPDVSLEELVTRILASRLRRMISVKGERGNPDIFRIEVVAPDPDFAARLANTVADLFVEERRTAQMQSLRAASDFAVEQLAAYRRKLEESERRLRQYEQMLASRSRNPSSENLTRVNRLLMNADLELRQERERLRNLRSQAMTPPQKNAVERPLPYDSKLLSLKADFLNLEDELWDMLLETTWKDPGVISLNDRIYRIRQELRSRIRRIISQEYTYLSPEFRKKLEEMKFLEIELKALEARQRKLKSYIESHKKRAESPSQLAEQQLKLQRLREEVEHNRRVYNSFFEQSVAAQISEALEVTKLASKFEVLEPAQRPLEPEKRRKIKFMLMGIVLGLGLGFGLAWGMEYIDRSLKTVEDMEAYLGLKVLATVPRIEGFKKPKKGLAWFARSHRSLTIATAVVALMALTLLFLVLTGRFPHFPFPG